MNIQDQKQLLETSAFTRRFVEFKLYRPIKGKVKKDINQAKQENKEWDIWVEGYIKRVPWTQLEWEEYTNIPF